jgi:hypothetical protein
MWEFGVRLCIDIHLSFVSCFTSFGLFGAWNGGGDTMQIDRQYHEYN